MSHQILSNDQEKQKLRLDIYNVLSSIVLSDVHKLLQREPNSMAKKFIKGRIRRDMMFKQPYWRICLKFKEIEDFNLDGKFETYSAFEFELAQAIRLMQLHVSSATGKPLLIEKWTRLVDDIMHIAIDCGTVNYNSSSLKSAWETMSEMSVKEVLHLSLSKYVRPMSQKKNGHCYINNK